MKKQGVLPYQRLNTPVLQVKFPSVNIIKYYKILYHAEGTSFNYYFERGFII